MGATPSSNGVAPASSPQRVPGTSNAASMGGAGDVGGASAADTASMGVRVAGQLTPEMVSIHS